MALEISGKIFLPEGGGAVKIPKIRGFADRRPSFLCTIREIKHRIDHWSFFEM